jgi:nicotinate-nucleotide--dimethylbenzimidazole phosphoribosyltransferase
MQLLQTTINQIQDVDQNARAAAAAHQAQLALPFRSLGRIHDFAERMAAITGNPRPAIQQLGVITMAGDHGVAAQGVSLYPQAVTREMVKNFMRGGAAVNVLARSYEVRITVVDMGVKGPLEAIDLAGQEEIRFANCRIAEGTDDISQGPAMGTGQAVAAIEAGIRIFNEEHDQGLDAVGTGDMGIANTTPSAAVAASLLQVDPRAVVNRGTGIDDEALANKVRVVRQALACNQPDPADGLDVLAKVGGYEIGGIAGVILGACARRTPVVVDGFISTAGALIAARIHPEVRHYLFGGHQSAVDGHALMLKNLGLEPMIDLGMRLGEGTGAVFGLSILRAASGIATEMLTFAEATVSTPQEEGKA